VTGKPVTTSPPVTVGGGTSDWSAAALSALVDGDGTENRAGATTAVLHLLFVHGSFQSNTSVLAVAFRGDSFAVFPDQMSGGLSLDPDRIATSVYIHETGHLLGLVDEALDDHRADPDDPSHCGCHSPDRNSVMYWAIDTTAIGQVLNGQPPTDFDVADFSDLARLRAGA
jgi:hypothetical protein